MGGVITEWRMRVIGPDCLQAWPITTHISEVADLPFIDTSLFKPIE